MTTFVVVRVRTHAGWTIATRVPMPESGEALPVDALPNNDNSFDVDASDAVVLLVDDSNRPLEIGAVKSWGVRRWGDGLLASFTMRDGSTRTYPATLDTE